MLGGLVHPLRGFFLFCRPGYFDTDLSPENCRPVGRLSEFEDLQFIGAQACEEDRTT
jgi:hypothetical protein